MNNFISVCGIIEFDPVDRTKKHKRQGVWKKTAIIKIDGDICSYYCWFIKKRYNLHLQTPLRNSHITFISDKDSEMNGDWEKVKNRWNGKEIEVMLNVDARSDKKNWWLNIPNEYKNELNIIRKELNLSNPFFPFHMTFGTAVNMYPKTEKGINTQRAKGMNEEHSKYIVKLITDGNSY